MRHIEFEGCTNFRDLGGYRTADGRTTRWRTHFRSADPSLMTPVDMGRVRELGLSTVIDFRSGAAIGLLGGPLSREAPSYHALAFEEAWVDVTAEMTWGDAGLSYLRHPNAQAQLKAGLEVLAGRSGLPAVFHCSRGIDRTGMFAGLVLGIIGVVETDIAADFALSARCYDREKAAAVMGAIMARASERAGLQERGDRLMALPAVNQPPVPETMLSFLDGVRTEYGSMRGYALGIGVAEGTLARLEEALLERDGAADHGSVTQGGKS